MNRKPVSHARRTLLKAMLGTGLLAMAGGKRALAQVLAADSSGVPLHAEYELHIAEKMVNFTGTPATATTINGTLPGTLLHLREGGDATIRVINHLKDATALHWHGLLVPNAQDGVPHVTFHGIPAGETFTYHFDLKQNGTYWYHSHSALQEVEGCFAPIIIDAAGPEPFRYEREFVVMLSDWIDTPGAEVLANLKKVEGYYNRRHITLPQFLANLKLAPDEAARRKLWDERMAWSKMRMDPSDISDAGEEWTYLMAGQTAQQNWTGVFKPGERIRLRFINASPLNFFDVRIPGLEMTVVQADGQSVRPVAVDEFRIGNGETYDVIVQPVERKAYTVFAPTVARIGYARGTLAPEPGMQAEVPTMDARPLHSLDDMGHAHTGHAATDADHSAHAEHQHAEHEHAEPGGGLVMPDGDGLRRLTYKHLRALEMNPDMREPTKEIVIRLTGDMHRFFWTLNDKKYSEMQPFEVKLGERVRFRFINETMMDHPMHLHGVYLELQNGNGMFAPMKHTVIVPPGKTVELNATYLEAGDWVVHCHLFYHMATGMMGLVKVTA
jgi:CopA family copper-resistance protein